MLNWSTSEIKWYEWTIVLIAILVPLISFLYMDTNSIIRCGIDVFRSIVEGRFFEYYDFAAESRAAGLMVHAPTYDILFYLTIGIWEIPLAIYELITGKNAANSSVANMYSKLLLLVFLIAAAYVIYKIAIQIKLNEKIAKWASFFFLTSGFVVAYLCIAGQYDIIGIFFLLLGIYFYLKNDFWKFI